MPSLKTFPHDIFLSYKAEQASWAIRLDKTLSDLGLDVFRDQNDERGQKVGDPWWPSLQQRIAESKRMLVLWSDLLEKTASSIVHQEINQMTLVNPARTEPRFLPVSLDGTSMLTHPVLGKTHGALSLHDLYARYKDDGAERIGSVEWFRAIGPLLRALGFERLREVRFVVAAMTRTQADELDAGKKAEDPTLLGQMKNLLAKTVPFDPSCYGASPNDWKPFRLPTGPTILELINQSDQARRNWARDRSRPIDWILSSLSDDLTSTDSQTRQSAIEAIQEDSYLAVIDPVSLLHKEVYRDFISNGGLQSHTGSFVVGISPCMPHMHTALNSDLTQVETALAETIKTAYDRYRKPYEPRQRTCVLNIEHEHQFARLLQVAVDGITSDRLKMGPGVHWSQRERIPAADQPTSPEVIDMGGRPHGRR